MTVCIIGAGPAGLVSAKSALECGLEPTIFEKSSTIGGLWKPHSGSTWDNMHTNISHHSCMFSDFGWKKNVAPFPNQREVYEYICQYAKEFSLDSHIHLNTEVIKVSKCEKKWHIEWSENGQKISKIFDFVIVSSGIFSRPYTPHIEGIETFSGPLMHSQSYKTNTPFSNKKVLIIGNAFSGCEIASEVATTAKKVLHSTHRSIWVLPRMISAFSGTPRKLPGDLLFYDRASEKKKANLSPDVINKNKYFWFQSLLSQTVDAKPEDPQFVAISDSYIAEVNKQKIQVKKSSVDHIEGNTVVFKDLTTEEVDSILLCTGYRTELPFFDQTLLKSIDFLPESSLQPFLLHKTVFHPMLENMAFVGMYRGPFFAVMELQARWASMVFSKKIPMPSEDEMRRGIEEERKIRLLNPEPQFPHGDYVRFADDLAKECRVLPDFDTMKEENPELYERLWNGPLTAPHYRLTGYAKKPELALELIQRTYDTYQNGV